MGARESTHIRKSLTLTAEEWSALEIMADYFQTLAPAGPRTGSPSWRSLVKTLADPNGPLVVVRRPNWLPPEERGK